MQATNRSSEATGSDAKAKDLFIKAWRSFEFLHLKSSEVYYLIYKCENRRQTERLTWYKPPYNKGYSTLDVGNYCEIVAVNYDF